MALDQAIVAFISNHADKGKEWIAARLDLHPMNVARIASQHRISLRKTGENRGRKPNSNSRAQRRVENREIRELAIEHPKVQMILASRYEANPKGRLRTRHWKKQRLLVLNRDAHTCVYCGDVATSVDHVIPRVAGGDDSMDNLVSACTRCNSRKGSLNGHVFLAQPFTPPAFVDKKSPIGSNRVKTDRDAQTFVKIDSDSPFSAPDQSGARTE